jgi:rare lipoprotein A
VSKKPKPTPTRTRTTEGGVSSSGTCEVSYYTDGSRTANGEPFDPNGLTAAHKTLPFNTMVRVTNLANGKSVTVRINDRGPFVSGRCLDLARGAFTKIASTSAGVIDAKYEVLK